MGLTSGKKGKRVKLLGWWIRLEDGGLYWALWVLVVVITLDRNHNLGLVVRLGLNHRDQSCKC